MVGPCGKQQPVATPDGPGRAETTRGPLIRVLLSGGVLRAPFRERLRSTDARGAVPSAQFQAGFRTSRGDRGRLEASPPCREPRAMTLHRPCLPAPADDLPDTERDRADDRRSRLIEAGILGGCCEGDLLALMPSIERDLPAPDARRTWLRRVLGF